MQGLSSLHPFTQNLLQNQPNEDQKITAQLQNLINEMKSGQEKCIQPYKMIEQIKRTSSCRFGSGRQEDAQEFALYLLDRLQEEEIAEQLEMTQSEPRAARMKHEDNSTIKKLFYGKFRDTLTCVHCKEKRQKEIDFSCLYVDIPTTQGRITLEDSLNHLKVEQVALPCEYCKLGLKAVKELQVQTYPKCLMVMIKRFDKLEKNNKMVHYPIQFKGLNLKAVIEHHGRSIASGHYKAKCWDQTTQRWYVMDDQLGFKIYYRLYSSRPWDI